MSNDYLLGHDDREWKRLADQHALWRDTLLPTAEECGVRPGARVLEIGCGPGDLLLDLAERVGPTGRVVGIEVDPKAVAYARARTAEKPWVEVRRGDLLHDDVGGPFDVVVARWVLHVLPDPGAVVARVARALVPGGALVAQDYDHDGLRIFPRSDAIETCVDAFRAAYKATGADLWIAGRLPGLYAAAGLTTERIDPCALAARPGEPHFRWVEDFLFLHLGTVHAAGRITSEQRALFERDWHRIKRLPGAVLFLPMQVLVVGRRPN